MSWMPAPHEVGGLSNSLVTSKINKADTAEWKLEASSMHTCIQVAIVVMVTTNAFVNQVCMTEKAPKRKKKKQKRAPALRNNFQP
jgi:ATP/ADP translocase